MTCRLTPQEVAWLPDAQSGCIAEVRGVLEYSSRMRRFTLRSLDGGDPAATAFFFRGRRTHFSEMTDGERPRFSGQVAAFIGRPVRVIGTAVRGQVTVDVGHIVVLDGTPLAGSRAP